MILIIILLAGLPFLYSFQKQYRFFENEDEYLSDLSVGLNRMYHELQIMNLHDGLKSNTTKSFSEQFNLTDEHLIDDLKEAVFVSYTYPKGIKNLKVIDTFSSEKGFFGVAFQQQNENIIIAFRGTDDIADIKSDLQLGRQKELPEQYADAVKFYKKIKTIYPEKRIIVTGHSLGGALSELVGSTFKENFAFSCMPVGTMQIIKRNGLKDYKNNYSVVAGGDYFSASFAHPGFVQKVKTDVMKWAHSPEHCFSK